MESEKINLKLKLRSFNSTAIDLTVISIIKNLSNFDCRIIGPIPIGRGIEDFSPEKPLKFEKKVKHKKELGKRARQDRLIIVMEVVKDVIEVLNKIKLNAGVGMEINISMSGN